ncbi:MAG TPA: phosphopentomutase [Candidatus Binatia bacterium]|nr:phosphopentomutase [Candidatus Binatia bacterium]
MARVVAIVLDGTGVGAMPDAERFGDAPGANTVANVAERVGGLRLPNFARLGLGNLTAIRGVAPAEQLSASIARLSERSNGKDTITGHWEMVGIITQEAFPTYPRGFPPEVVERFTAIAGKPPLGNKAASGTEIIAELGAEHQRTGRPILYTSADSVFQVAAHEQTVPLATLYRWCEEARAMLVPPDQVNRVIARPFEGPPDAYARTPNRRDYAVSPPINLIDRFAAQAIPVHAVGKISDIFCGRGIASSVRVVDNTDAMLQTSQLLDRVHHGFIFVNLNDFDTKYGHRRDVRGFADALERLDSQLPDLTARLRSGDRVIFTADHGCDPTAPGTDHTREYVPFIELGAPNPEDLGTIVGLDQVGREAAAALGSA